MRILIVTAGSRGDVAPFTGLGRRLLDVGHRVTVAAHPPFASLVDGCGLGYRSLPGDPYELICARTRAASPEEVRAATTEFLDRLADGVVAAVADGTDLVLTAFGPASLSQAAGEAIGVPVIGTYLAPAFATREFPLPGMPDGDDLGPEGNFAAGRALLARAGALQDEVLTRLRARLRARLRGDRYGHIINSGAQDPYQLDRTLALLRTELDELRFFFTGTTYDLRQTLARFDRHEGLSVVLDTNDLLH
ncbi:glycosyltransferase [Kitasatospora sp. NPDC057542]|uniref:glycosyltransferase n=1 Tax=Kitasatospora sp. NPDC057542 TaxID=3346162 RepID=UPI0036A8036B